MNARDFERVMKASLELDPDGGPTPTQDLAAVAWREGRRRHTRRVLGGGLGATALVAAAAATAFALTGGFQPEATDTMPAGTGTVTDEPSNSSDAPVEQETQIDADNQVLLGGGHSLDLVGEWRGVTLSAPSPDAPEDSGPVTQSCVTTTQAWVTSGCADGVQISTGLTDKPDYTEAHQAEDLVCAPDTGSSVAGVEDLGTSSMTIDGHPAEHAEWQATCASGETFRLEEIWIADAGVFLYQHSGVAHLDELAQDLSLTGEAPDVESSMVVVDDVGGDSWAGETHVWDPNVVEGSAFLPTGERQTLDLAGVTCLGGGTPPGLNEQVVECADLATEIQELSPDHPVRVISDEEGTVLTIGIQYQA